MKQHDDFSRAKRGASRVNAQLIESDDEHHWVLLDHRVTQLVIDRSSVRIQTWSLDGSADIRLAASASDCVGSE